MKTLESAFLLFLFTAINENNLSAQKSQMGIDFGIGKTGTEEYNPKINPFNKDNEYRENYYKIGLSFLYTPKKLISFKTGVYYDYRGPVYTSSYSWDDIGFLKIPAGLEFSIGRVVQFTFGFGFYTGFLISSSGTEDPARFYFGLQRNFGIGFQFSPDLVIAFTYQRDMDLTAFYRESARSPGGAPYENLHRGYDGFYNVSLKFNIKKKIQSVQMQF